MTPCSAALKKIRPRSSGKCASFWRLTGDGLNQYQLVHEDVET